MSWNNKARLSLESLDGRIVPNATSVLPDPGPEPPANVSTTAPPAPARPVAEIEADIQNILQQLEANACELEAARSAELAHSTGPYTQAVLRVADVEAALRTARDEDKPSLEYEHQLALGQLQLVATTQEALFANRVRLRDIRASLNAMLNALEDELRRAKPGQVQTGVNPPTAPANAVGAQPLTTGSPLGGN